MTGAIHALFCNQKQAKDARVRGQKRVVATTRAASIGCIHALGQSEEAAFEKRKLERDVRNRMSIRRGPREPQTLAAIPFRFEKDGSSQAFKLLRSLRTTCAGGEF